MTSTNDIVVVGSCNIDFVSYSPRLPVPGETIQGREFVTNFGGKGANQCIAAAKLGGQTILIARVGDDVWGPKYIEVLKTHQVNTDYVQITTNYATGIAQILVCDHSGKNQIVITHGANGCLQVRDIEKAENVISRAGVLILQLETSEEVAIKAMELCKGISILNAAPAPKIFKPQLLKLPTILCVNKIEASIISDNLPINNLSEVEKVASTLISKGCNIVIITMGENGAFYMNKQEKFHVLAPNIKCLDSTGAGDQFIGALAFLLISRKDISMREAIEKSCFIASDSATRYGSQVSFADHTIFSREF